MTQQLTVTVLAVGVMLLGIVMARLLAWVSARLRQHQLSTDHTVIAEYGVPSQLSPAELGYIIDARFGSNELLATIAQLYAKKLVTLKALPGDDFQISTTTHADPSVDNCESCVLGYVRSLPDGVTTWKQLDSAVSEAVGPQADFEDSVLGSLVSKGLLYESSLKGLLFRSTAQSIVSAAILSLAYLMGIGIWQGAHELTQTSTGFISLDRDVAFLIFLLAAAPVWLLAFAYVNLLLYIYGHRDGVPLGGTEQLNKIWPDVAGYQLYLRETEYVRLQHDHDACDASMAYCLALGLDPGFVKSLHT